MRQRLTWADKARQAAAAPATPNEGPASPAYKADPAANAYENGDTSAWAEDVHPGPYPNSAHPATPDEGPASPAYKAAALERKAAKCIRIATAMLGESASYKEVEDQALTLMDLSDRAIKASLVRLGEDEAEEDEAEEDESMHSKKAFSGLTARVARLERILIRLAAEDEAEEDEAEEDEAKKKSASRRRRLRAKSKAAYGYAEDEMFAEMLKEEGMDSEMGEDELLEMMLKEEGMEGELVEVSETLPETLPEAMEHGHDEAMEHGHDEMMSHGEMGHDEMMHGEMMHGEMMEPMGDPMGVMDAEMGEDELMILANLYGRSAGDKKEEQAEEKAAETLQEEAEHKAEEKDEAKKKASLRPRTRTNGTGATRLGGPVSKAASSEISELAKLWESAPDVSKHF